MDSADQLSTTPDPVVIGRVVSPTEKAQIQKAFVMLLDWMEEKAEDAMVDWSTFETATDRYLDPESGQEFVQIRAAVRVMEMTL